MRKPHRNRISYLVLTFIAGLLLSVTNELQASAWAAVISVNRSTGYGEFQYGWTSELNDSPICFDASGCFVLVGPWDARGSGYGGINNPWGISRKVKIPQYGSARDAWFLWSQSYPLSDQFVQLTWSSPVRHDFLQTCYGFQIFQGSSSNTRTGDILPGAQCGTIPPPNLVCTLNLPSEIDHGTIGVGETSSIEVDGAINCNLSANARLSSQLSNAPSGLSAKMLFNGMSTRNLSVQAGNTSFKMTSELTVQPTASTGPAQIYFMVFADFY
ncbi:hypothetical protein [Pseudomonas sp. 8O]|uniref:hypothetical protein n=1 Tax=Pseudomonas sp. 8O TaxID=2653165 RepID=UPI0012F18D15|nr:hypothetical protein [Pseudomonas sp. 8O]VXC36344.1 hypothetical protein PSEUDO8O_31049 [Pseudomonas sp. 8O]